MAHPDSLPVGAFLAAGDSLGPILDVRTPSEHAHARLPGAKNLPLFSDSERAAVGTAYAHDGPREALLLGLDAVGPRLRELVDMAERLAPGGHARLHCWRGGMRSGSVAWLLRTAGMQVTTLDGGYRAYRRHALGALETPRPVRILGGLTGSGKTAVLHALRERGASVLDIEGLARHRGSVFGDHDADGARRAQPSQEQFENDLSEAWRALPERVPVWVEDESRRLGALSVPAPIWTPMTTAEVVVLDAPVEARAARLVADYGALPPGALVERITRLTKRLGGQRAKDAVAALESGDLLMCATILLDYYDRTYRHHLARRGVPTRHLRADPSAPEATAEALLALEDTESRTP